MVQIANLAGISDNPPPAATLSQFNFSRGVITLVDESKIPKNALKRADNLIFAEDGAPKVRPGIGWYGTAPTAFAIDGAEMWVDSSDVSHIVVAAGGQVWRSINDGATWQQCSLVSGSTTPFTPGKKVHSENANSFMYLFNGWDNIVRYDGSTTLQGYTSINSPTMNTPSKTGLAGTSFTLYYRVSAVNDIGYTQASASAQGMVQTSLQRDSFSDTNFTTLTWSAVPGAVRYDLYVGQIQGQEVYFDSVDGQATTTYIDKGKAVEQVAILAPDSNTTQGVRCSDMSLIGSRLYATGDRDFPYRIWISGAGRFIGQFSSAYDATYLDWQKGGNLKPVKVEDYRNGKNDPVATVWCKSKDGRGAVLQGTLEQFTVGSITFPVPNFFKLPGSRGTEAPDSVVNVLNDYFYYNEQAIYNLGSRAQFLNLLSTDEASANIRPNIKRVRPSAAKGIAGHFTDAKLFMSLPIDSDVNNTTAMYDTEQKNWNPQAFTVGFERFFTYADNTTAAAKHTVCWKPGDTRLSEISDAIKGDYGAAFQTTLITGLMSVNPKNRFDFLWCEEAEVEFAQPQGVIGIELSGITREDGFRSIDKKYIRPSSTRVSWGLSRWSTHRWSVQNTVAQSYSEPSTKRYFTIQQDINAYQYRVDTNDLAADYILRTLQINGTATEAGKPREWELFDS